MVAMCEEFGLSKWQAHQTLYNWHGNQVPIPVPLIPCTKPKISCTKPKLPNFHARKLKFPCTKPLSGEWYQAERDCEETCGTQTDEEEESHEEEEAQNGYEL